MKGAKLYTFGIFGALDISAVEADILTTMSDEQSKAQNEVTWLLDKVLCFGF